MPDATVLNTAVTVGSSTSISLSAGSNRILWCAMAGAVYGRPYQFTATYGGVAFTVGATGDDGNNGASRILWMKESAIATAVGTTLAFASEAGSYRWRYWGSIQDCGQQASLFDTQTSIDGSEGTISVKAGGAVIQAYGGRGETNLNCYESSTLTERATGSVLDNFNSTDSGIADLYVGATDSALSVDVTWAGTMYGQSMAALSFDALPLGGGFGVTV